MAEAVPPWDELDPGIVDVVRGFWEAGFQTVSSCQGHAGGDAFVTFLPPPAEKIEDLVERVRRWLLHMGWHKAVIIEVRFYGVAEKEREGPWVTVTWWGEVPFR